MFFKHQPVFLYFLICNLVVTYGNIPPPPTVVTAKPSITVHKCCKENELMISDYCQEPNETYKSYLWTPVFTLDDGLREAETPPYSLTTGFPNCGSRQQWPIFEYAKSSDELVLLTNGKMRHIVQKSVDTSDSSDEEDQETERSYEYQSDQYCMDKIIMGEEPYEAEVAIICAPDIESLWHEPDFIMKRLINPICHGVAICCFLVIAVVYFVLPQLSDLIGNIITTIAICLIITQISDIIRIFAEFNSEFSFFIADVGMYISFMGAFFWLNCMGYYIWNAFKSRSVFIRITDGRKYCYYSLYAWLSTFSMGGMAVFAHLFLDTNKPSYSAGSLSQGVIGWLGLSIFFIPIAVIILVNVFFCLSTLENMKRTSTYGRIHHKLRYQFQLFVKFFILMTTNWFIFFLTWLPFNAIFYVHIFINLLQALLLVYVSVIELKRVRFLIRKACCYEKCICACCRPGDPGEAAAEWGEEMMAINTSTTVY